MPTISRPVKTFGTTRYTDEGVVNAPNPTVIKDTEVDADLDLAYQTINALDDANIAPAAGIAGSKLAAGIDGAKISAGTMPGDRLTDLSVGVSKLVNLSITTGKLAVGAAVWQFVRQQTPLTWDDGDPADQLVAEATWVPRSASAKLVILGIMSGFASLHMPNSYAASEVTTRLRLGGTAGVATDGTVVDTAIHRYTATSNLNFAFENNLDLPVSGVLAFGGITAETRMKIHANSAYTLGVNATVTFNVTGTLFLVEFA